jgi:hypothetical protein
MKEQKDKLETEISTMNSLIGGGGGESSITGIAADDDVIEIDAGGKIIRALRSTLTLAPDTMFTFMFSGRWEESLKRHNNRIFLDHDPELIEIIINFLRMKKIEDPLNIPVRTPKVHVDKKEDFDYLLRYFGLTEYLYPPPQHHHALDIAKINVVQPHGLFTVVTKSEKKIQFSHNRPTNHSVECKPSLNSSGGGSFWKVTVDAIPGRVCLGIIGNLDATRRKRSFTDSSFNGWLSFGKVYKNGLPHGDTHSTFTVGECFYFHLKEEKLTMFRVKTKQKIVVDDVVSSNTYYIHFRFWGPGSNKISLEPLNEDERTEMIF